MVNDSSQIEQARRAYEARRWQEALDGFRAASAEGPLLPDDRFAMGDAAWWLGDVAFSTRSWEDAYRTFLHGERPRRAATIAMAIAINHFLRGDEALGGGWVGRMKRLLEGQPEGVEHGYAKYMLEVEADIGGAEVHATVERAREVQELARRHGDRTLAVAGLMGEGRALIRAGRVAEGMALLDEVMVALLTEDLSLDWAGNIYCNLMEAANEVADVRRLQQWTNATEAWLENLPAAVLFHGICRIHRSQVMQSRGAWAQAELEASRVSEDLADFHVAGAAEGHYQVGDLRRLRGDLEGAARAYAKAHLLGRDPQPGQALLALVRGDKEAADVSIRAALVAVPDDRLRRARLLIAQVDIAFARGDDETCSSAAEELVSTAAGFGTSGLQAAAEQARGTALLAASRYEEALSHLRIACSLWRDLGAPHDAARSCLLLARVYEGLEDLDTSRRELDVAISTFTELGARPDLETANLLRPATKLPGGLTEREAEVLRLVASGMTNREVGEELFITRKTVARHLSSIFRKVGVSSRTEAAAYAFEHKLATSVSVRERGSSARE